MPESDSSAVSLESFVGQAFDGPFAGYSNETETPQRDTDSAAGAPPAEPSRTTDEASADSEGAQDDDQGATSADQPAAETPDPALTPDAVVSQDDDPTAGAEPLTYTVNGQTRTFDDIKVLKDHGAIVPLDALPKLQQRLSERDNLYERSQQQYQQYQELERLTTWTTKGADGAEVSLTGAEAIQAQQIALATTTAALQTFTAALSDPQTFASLVALDAEGNVILNQQTLEHLVTRSRLAEMGAAQHVEKRFAGLSVPAQAQKEPDPVQSAPAVVQSVARQLNVTSLTPEDEAFLAEMMPKFVRPATAEDLREHPMLRVGQSVVDVSFGQLVQRQAQMRTTTAQSVTTASAVSKENAAKLAQAARGIPAKGPAKAPAPTRPQPRQEDRSQDADSLFSMQERAASGRF